VYASIVVASVAVDRVHDLADLYGRFLPPLREAPGWRGVYLVVDRSNGDGHLIGLWETEDHALAFERDGAFGRLLADYPPGILLEAPRRSVGEVIFHAAAQSP
jgi:hypothetical protein